MIPANSRVAVFIDTTPEHLLVGTLLHDYDGTNDAVYVRSGTRTLAIPGCRVLYIETTETVYFTTPTED